MIALTGYDSLYGAAGSHAAAAAVTDALASGRSVVTLNDGSTISFVGNTQGLHIMSS